MRRILPFLIVAVGLLALAVAVLPINRPFTDPPRAMDTRLGLDLRGGLRGEYQVIATDDQQVTPEILETTRSIIEQRVNATGLSEPIVQTQGTNRISVEIPGVENVDQVRDLIGSTGRLDFVPVPAEFSPSVVDGAPLPAGMDVTPLFSGDEIAVAQPAFGDTGQPEVQFTLKENGARLFEEYTRANIGQRFAIVLDEVVVSAPTIEGAIPGGQARITGSFTVEEMNNLVTVLKYGALPLEINEVGFSQVSATLGQSFLEQSLVAGAIGLGLVCLFMLLHYRLPGAVAIVALIYYGIVMLALFRFIPVTLTLAGVAAAVLSIGMAVDANVLIFERTKEELRAGKTVSSAVEAGFNRAWTSIFDANVSSLITGAILYYFGSPIIKGFALVLILGVIVSMFTALTLSREILRWVVRQSWSKRAAFFGVAEDEFTIAAAPVRGRSREAGARV
ncbi:MAG: protein translocase subunit SecD [Chloroflexi bacterium]|nr:protein translocase subunit SecD [Chloroflexota bacterium]MBA3852567.1 protein translocase subunit SecD [Chloroflexota bacterium]